VNHKENLEGTKERTNAREALLAKKYRLACAREQAEDGSLSHFAVPAPSDLVLAGASRMLPLPRDDGRSFLMPDAKAVKRGE